jgi:uncharacterized membrane protein YeiB
MQQHKGLVALVAVTVLAVVLAAVVARTTGPQPDPLAGRPVLSEVASRLGDVGRMALTSYLGATLIATTVFNGYGLGLFGTLPRARLYLLMAGIWCFQIAFARLWLRAFQYGPAEWTWRSLTYWKRQPLRRSG